MPAPTTQSDEGGSRGPADGADEGTAAEQSRTPSITNGEGGRTEQNSATGNTVAGQAVGEDNTGTVVEGGDERDGGDGGNGGDENEKRADGGDEDEEGDGGDEGNEEAPKAGNQPKFKGASAKFLSAYQYRFDEIRQMKAGKVKALRTFWHDVYKLFWDKFTLEEIRALWGKEAGWAHSVLFTADLRAFSERLVEKVEAVKVETVIKTEEGDASAEIVTQETKMAKKRIKAEPETDAATILEVSERSVRAAKRRKNA